MRYRIEHRTSYHYARPAALTRQLLRLTPRPDAHQRLLHWHLRVPGALDALADAYGNAGHLHVIDGEHRSIRIDAVGEVEIDPLRDGRLEEVGELPPAVFLATTPLTDVDERLGELVRRHLRGRSSAHLFEFALAVRAAINYRPGTTNVRTSAVDALALGQGVCQDHAHAFIAGCRAAGIPARYVSGYYHRAGQAREASSHAWADAWDEDDGWVSIDITHECFAGQSLCRLAVGRDYESASPVRGVRVGGGAEAMEATVLIEAATAGPDRTKPEFREEVAA
jgi:transglutaminase-like putative cysteine protease